MNCERTQLPLYAITDRTWLKGQTLYEAADAALRGGATCLQLREKELDRAAFLVEAVALAQLCRDRGVPLIVNDDVDIAIESGADGVHIGQHDAAADQVRRRIGPNRILGVSAQTVEQALKAERDGADYLGVGAVFSTGTKPDAREVSFDTLRAICQAVHIPVVAIGGVRADNLGQLAGSGVAGVAVVSAVFAAEDVEAAARDLRETVRRELKV